MYVFIFVFLVQFITIIFLKSVHIHIKKDNREGQEAMGLIATAFYVLAMSTNCSFVLFYLLIFFNEPRDLFIVYLYILFIIVLFIDFIEWSLRHSYSIVRLYSQNSDSCFIVLSGVTILSLAFIERLPANKIPVSSRSLYLIWSDSKLSIVSIVQDWCARLFSRIIIH